MIHTATDDNSVTTGVFCDVSVREHLLWALVGVLAVSEAVLALTDPQVGAGSSVLMVTAALLGLVGAVMAFRIARIAARHPESPSPLDDRIAELRANLAESGRLIRQITAEVELQATAAEKIKTEVKQNRRLTELNAEQAQAVKNLVESVQARASKLGGRQQWLFFLAGLLASVPLGVVGNFAFDFVKAWLATH